MQAPTRLTIYDQVIGDLDVPIADLVTKKIARPRHFPQLTPGLYRYFYLGWCTIQPLLPVYQQQIRRWLAINWPGEQDIFFEQAMLETGYRICTGATEAQITSWLESDYPDVYPFWDWEMSVGNLAEFFPYTAGSCLLALDHWIFGLLGFLPFINTSSIETYDNLSDISSNRDVTPYVWAAMVSAASVPLEQLQEGKPQFNPQASLDFWRWWLFELVPQAAAFDHDAAGWHIDRSWYEIDN